MKTDIPRVDVLGVKISAINMSIALEEIERWISSQERAYICLTPAHSIMDCYTNPDLYPLFNGSNMTTPDGMSIVWLLKLRGYSYVERVTGSDLMDATMRYSAQRGWKHYFYGGQEGIPEKLTKHFLCRYPDLKIVGAYSPPFRPLTPEEDEDVVARIHQAKPDIIWVGISSPKQEIWMASHVDILDVPILIGVGAAFDFLSGKKKRAPLWMQKTGLEWLFRFITEPKRLWPRYRMYPWFSVLALAQMLGFRKQEK